MQLKIEIFAGFEISEARVMQLNVVKMKKMEYEMFTVWMKKYEEVEGMLWEWKVSRIEYFRVE